MSSSPRSCRWTSSSSGPPVTPRQAAGAAPPCTEVPCNPFDIVGAARAGMRTAWIDRSGRTFDTLGRLPDVVVRELSELAALRTPAAG